MTALDNAYKLIRDGAIGELKFIQVTLSRSIADLQVATVAGWISALRAVVPSPRPKSIVAAQGQCAGGATLVFEGEDGRRPFCSVLWSSSDAAECIAFIGSTGRIICGSEELTLVDNESPDVYPGAYQGLYIPVAKKVLSIEHLAACSPNEPTQEDMRMATGVLESIASTLAAPESQQPPPLLVGQTSDVTTGALFQTAALFTPLDIQMGLTSASDMSHPLRWGILTAGRICKDFVQALKLARLRGCGAIVTAVAARKLEDAEEFVKELELSEACSAYGSYSQLCADPNVDIVYVGTITSLHSELTLLAIQGNKHVVCEKPLASNMDEVRAMFAAADKAGVLLQEGMWTRFFPATEHARAAIRRGDIGIVETLTATFPDRCYPVQAAPMVFGTHSVPVVVAAGSANGGSGGSATLVYGSGSGASGAGDSGGGSAAGGGGCGSTGGGVAVVSMPTFSESQFDESFVVRGTGGTVVIEAPAHCPTKVTINGVMAEYPLPAYDFRGGYPQCNQHGFFYEIEAVHRALANNLRECPQHTRADSLAVMGIIALIQEQAGGTVHT